MIQYRNFGGRSRWKPAPPHGTMVALSARANRVSSARIDQKGWKAAARISVKLKL
jgi:hypothetical protein